MLTITKNIYLWLTKNFSFKWLKNLLNWNYVYVLRACVIRMCSDVRLYIFIAESNWEIWRCVVNIDSIILLITCFISSILRIYVYYSTVSTLLLFILLYTFMCFYLFGNSSYIWMIPCIWYHQKDILLLLITFCVLITTCAYYFTRIN